MANTEIQPNKIMQLKRGQRIALISTLLILLLAVFKWLVGHFFNSQLLVADAWHSLSDVLINLTSLIGLWLASRKKTTRFPYGLYRAETLACFFIGGLIIYIGVDLFREGWGKLFQLELTTEFPVFPVGAALVSSGLACVLAVKQRAVGKAIGSQALMATARDAFFDIFTSLVVLAGILLVYAEIPYVEGVVVMIISILIVKLGIETAITSVLILMDANLDSDLQSEIEEKLNSIYGVKGVTGVKIRQSGPFKMVECIIRTNPSLPLYRTHSLADRAEEILFNDYDNIESAFVHVEPDKNYVIKAIVPVHSKDGINSRIHGHFGRAPYFMVFTLNGKEIEVLNYYENEFLDQSEHIGLKVVRAISAYSADLLFAANVGEISFHMLKNNFVDIYKVNKEISVADAVHAYQNNELAPIFEPTHSIENSPVMKSN